MNANQPDSTTTNFDPRELITRAKRRRDRSARFDAFSDAYIWVLIAVITMVYLYIVVSAAIFVLVGEGVDAIVLPSTVFKLQDLTVVLLPVILVGIFRGLLYIGPCAVSPDRASWWLPLPINLHPLRRRTLGISLVIGATASVFVWALWLLGVFALTGHSSIPVLATALVAAASSGIFLAALAVLVQLRSAHRIVIRLCRLTMTAFYLTLMVSWALLLNGAHTVATVFERAGALFYDPLLWGVTAGVFAMGALLAASLAIAQIKNLSVNSLRESGQIQHVLLGSVQQLELGGIPKHQGSKRRPARFGTVTRLKIPMVAQLLILRYLRGQYWKPALSLTVCVVGLVLAIQSIANPIALAAFFAVLLGLLTLSLGQVNRPLASQPGLAQMLGIPRIQLVKPVLALTFGLALTPVMIWSVLIIGLGQIPLANIWPWCVAVLLAGGGTVSAAWIRANQGARNWDPLLFGSTNEMNVVSFILGEARSVLLAVTSGLPIYFLLVLPTAEPAWGIWLISLACSYPGYQAWRSARKK